MEIVSKRLLTILLLCVLIFSCKKKEDDPPTGPNETPPENVFGSVTDLSGAPLANVQMHLVYSVHSITTSPLDDIQNPTIAVFYTEQMLTTECGGDVPLADGTNILIMWDADDDHAPSAGDRQPTACINPDDCPFQSVNFNQFALNGVALGLGAGRFGTDPAFTSSGEHLEPSRFYLEIRCTDGNVLWRSELVDIPDGLTDQPLDSMYCLTCVGTPVGETSLGHAYPNPLQETDDVAIPFTLRANSEVTLSTRSLSTGIVTSHFSGAVEQGVQERNMNLSELPNGVYVYSMTSTGFTGQDTLLKNISTTEGLQGTPAITTTDGAGEFALNAPFGSTIMLRGFENNPLGESLPLDSVRVVAILNGYFPSDTTIVLSALEQHNVNLRLRPE